MQLGQSAPSRPYSTQSVFAFLFSQKSFIISFFIFLYTAILATSGSAGSVHFFHLKFEELMALIIRNVQ
jgi:hypothetical protein